ncbi:yiaA/B two helix domain protein [Mycobacterium sp. THAF192]|jgi:hypothetical protein|nr:yiaA/B two helix domain protein [Mycobacterium sp. THAF192]
MPAGQRRRQAERMDAFDAMSKNTSAFFLQAAIAFGVSFLGVLGGIFFLPLDIWPRLFLAMSAVFLVTSSFTLAKVIRDQQEAATIRVRLDEVRMEKLLAEHNPFTTDPLK